jgi:hypothetical protein
MGISNLQADLHANARLISSTNVWYSSAEIETLQPGGYFYYGSEEG